jgi:hypothetical protein
VNVGECGGGGHVGVGFGVVFGVEIKGHIVLFVGREAK